MDVFPASPAEPSVKYVVGILVHGDNHFIVRGPMPSRMVAHELARQWSLIQIDGTIPSGLDGWRILTREFRENLQWAVVVKGDGEVSSAVAQLLAELRGRGIEIHEWQ
jgi:hypothetical protein